jgi:uncharacterized protein
MNAPVALPVWPHAESPFHEAELRLQERAGRREALAAFSHRGIRGELIEQHREFFPQLPFLLVGSVDADGQPWASMLWGQPGFAHSPDPFHLRIDAKPAEGDPLAANIVDGAAIGLLGIQPSTRRRNRMNGRVEAAGAHGFSVRVVQSYGNCPKYIQARDFAYAPQAWPASPQTSEVLSDADRALIAQADTFFVASSNPHADDGPASGVDVSHRGGKPGFVRVDEDGVLTVPDFIGNNFFNTLGNLTVEPRAGLLFVDFERGDLLMLAVRAEVVLEGSELDAFEGALRLVRYRVERVLRLDRALPWRSTHAPEQARELAATGSWN